MTYFNNKRRRRRGRYNNRRRSSRRRFNNRHHRSRRRSRNGRRRSRNGSVGGGGAALSLRSPVKAALAGFNFGTLKKAGVFGVGMLANAWATGFVGGFLPSVLSSAPGNYVIGLAAAGILGAGTAMVSRAYAPQIFFGGVLKVAIDILNRYVVPMIPHIPFLHGLGDYLTPQAAAAARPLNGLGYFGDYLTPQAAANARPLNGMGDFGNMNDSYISEELAAL
jgi:hypothetical protein